MNTGRYEDKWDGAGYHRGNTFDLLDLTVRLEFVSETSAGFLVGVLLGSVFSVRGHLQVHHPCEGHIKTRIFCSLPEGRVSGKPDGELLESAVHQIMSASEILTDETYVAHFLANDHACQIENRRDRRGYVDALS